MMFKFLRNFTFLIMVVVTPYTQATIYSWVDSDGNTHFSDIPASEETIEVDVYVSSYDLSMSESKSSNQQSQRKQQDNNQGSNRQGGEDNQGGENSQLMPPPDGNMQGSGMNK